MTHSFLFLFAEIPLRTMLVHNVNGGSKSARNVDVKVRGCSYNESV